VVDVGCKAEGQVPLREFAEEDGSINVRVGDKIEVLLEATEDQNGLVILSKDKARKRKVWDEIQSACEAEGLVRGIIQARVKGGLAVLLQGGVKAFLPGSQVDLRPVRNLDIFINKEFDFKIIKFNKKRGNIVLSRRVLLEAERANLKSDTLNRLQEDQIVEGVVKNLTDYGAFIDLGGIDGLLHITDMSWGRVNHPSELFQVGDKVKVKVLKFNSDSSACRWASSRSRRTRGSTPRALHPRHRGRGQGRQHQGLRRLRRARGGHRGPRARVRDVVDPPDQEPEADPQDRRRGPRGGPRHRRVAEPHLPRHEAARGEPV
jgi:predicted RNA-binding protein with RPS1 domain